MLQGFSAPKWSQMFYMSQFYLEIIPTAGLNYRLDRFTVFWHSRRQTQVGKFIREGCMRSGEWVANTPFGSWSFS